MHSGTDDKKAKSVDFLIHNDEIFFNRINSTYFFRAFHNTSGHFNTTYQDPSRGNRNIETEVYYPATTAGDNTPMASRLISVIVFGHGFVMV